MRRAYWLAGTAAAVVATAVLVIQPSRTDANNRTVEAEAKKEAGKSATASQLPIAQVVLFSSGVGYFQREGTVEGDQRIDLTFPVQDINDLIKSMTLRDTDGGHVTAVSFDGNAPIERTLKSFAVDLTGNPGFGLLLNQARGEKVEVVLQQANATQPGTLTGSVVGVETKKQVVGKDAAADVEVLNLWCADGIRSVKLGDVQRVRFLNPIMETEFRKALETVALSHDTQKKAVSIHFAGQGKRGVKVGYVVENPVWKTSYRLVLNKDEPKQGGGGDKVDAKDEKKAKPYLQGWAVVENVTDEDWGGVKMALISGRPISFKMNLYDALFVQRPVVEPELFASLRPPTYSGGFGFAGGGTPAPTDAGVPDDAMADSKDKAPKSRVPALRKRLQDADGTFEKQKSDVRFRESIQQELAAEMNLGRSVSSAASASKLGDYFQYVIDHPVTLPRQKSALLPIVGKDVEGERVSIYNENTHAKFSLLGLVFTNTTGMHLTQGPITVFEGSTYAGDARILDLQKGERRLLSYAIDLGTEVQAIPHSDNGKITSLKVVKGVVYTTTKVKDTKTYKLVNRNEDNRTVLVEHPNRTDFKLTSKDQPWETASDVHRFRVSVPAGKTVDYVVSEERDFGSSLTLTNSDDQSIRILINEKATSDKVKDAFQKALGYRSKLAESQRELQQVQRTLADIEKDQARLRQNLREMPPQAEAYKRYLKKFDDQESEIEALQKQIKELQAAEHAQRKEYENWLANLSVE